jgi:predicted Ser/Thr protein kinase
MKRADEITQTFKLVNNQYQVEDRVGGGSFGDVFIGRNVTTGVKYAIKFEKKCQYVYQTLPKEAKVLNIMESVPGFAQLQAFTTENGFNILIMNLLGPNLEKLFKFCDGSLR